MGINPNRTFGEADTGNVTTFGRRPNAGAQSEQPAAQFWINLGYSQTVTNAETNEPEQVFVSLPYGIPLDTQKAFELKGSPNMVKLRDAQNKLLDSMITAANKLAPGEERLICVDETTGLSVQMRRIKDPVTAVADADNELVVAINL